MPKDLFSAQAHLYAQYRPAYPKELFDYVTGFVKEKKRAWDCATGNGQAASVLADYFEKVIATDISGAQLSKAVQKGNIVYQKASAEKSGLPENAFDLITVAQAYHWLNWEVFYKEAIRVGKNGAVVAVWAYYTLHSEDENLQRLFDHFYWNISAPYWDAERKYIDEKYETVKFDFAPLPVRPFQTEVHWTKQHFKGYLESWSAVQHSVKVHGFSPVSLIEEELDSIWRDEEMKRIVFPVCMRLGRIMK